MGHVCDGTHVHGGHVSHCCVGFVMRVAVQVTEEHQVLTATSAPPPHLMPPESEPEKLIEHLSRPRIILSPGECDCHATVRWREPPASDEAALEDLLALLPKGVARHILDTPVGFRQVL